MSLKPTKKSDTDKEWLTKRSERKKKIQPEYHLLITEGTQTEPKYFTAIKDLINQNYSKRIHLEIVGQGDNTVHLFDKAKQLVRHNPNGYKHVWIIYDTDDFPKDNIDIIPVLCENESNSDCKYHAIWSNQCIELWFLLHFSFMHSDLHRDEYKEKLSACLRTAGAGTYRKNRDDMFLVLKNHLDFAIENAKRLDKLNAGKTPSKSAPGTKVFELIEKLKPYM